MSAADFVEVVVVSVLATFIGVALGIAFGVLVEPPR